MNDYSLGGANRWERQSAADGRGPDGPPQRFCVDACISNDPGRALLGLDRLTCMVKID
jgi:hypothetical protein